jgi:flagellar hook protein FlgE
MSLSGALSTAVTGLDAQSAALGAISDNVANSQTAGYKRIDTRFSTLISVSNEQVHQPGGVLSRPSRTNDVQGAMQQTAISTNLGISGQGFFVASRATGISAAGVPTFDAAQLYTRAGDWNINSIGFLTNTAGLYLNAWPVDPVSGAVQKNSLEPIRVTQLKDNPQPTHNLAYNANLPAAPDAKLDVDTTTPDIDFPPSQVQIYDSLGAPHNLDMNWTKVAGDNNTWELKVTSSEPGVTIAPAGVTTFTFNVADDPLTGAKAGSIQMMNGVAGTVDTEATLPLSISFSGPASSTQAVNLNLGKFGNAEQLTMFTGNDVEFHSAQGDGLPPGSFKSLDIDNTGIVTINYTNGARKVFFQIPLATFSDPNGLNPESGNAFTASTGSGAAQISSVGAAGAGTLIPSSVEGSNVDIAAEFTKMIQTQRAYSANTKVITATSELLDETNQMVR